MNDTDPTEDFGPATGTTTEEQPTGMTTQPGTAGCSPASRGPRRRAGPDGARPARPAPHLPGAGSLVAR